MLLYATLLCLPVTKAAVTVPGPLKATVLDGVTYTVVAPEDIPEWVKAAANPANSSAGKEHGHKGDGLRKRANAGVYVCTDINWRGYCVHIDSLSGVCDRPF